ncbi:ArsR/SmtB family transcription factor [Lacticaseibacillus chiayiensis]|uniref:ArsR/SmtB family transcription factor n=1 Tax=Lacticaseibacillus chiayiensis TaxID=2100821 RepID=UPI003C7064C6
MDIEQEDKTLANIFKVLGEPHRIEILRILYHAGRELTCTEVSAQLNLSKSTVSYHFRAMRLAGLTNTRQVAQTKYLSINTTVFEQFLPGFLATL